MENMVPFCQGIWYHFLMEYGIIFFRNISLFQKQNKPFSFSILAFLILKKGRIKSSNGMKFIFALLKLIFHHTGTPLQIVYFVHFGICLRKSYTDSPVLRNSFLFTFPMPINKKRNPKNRISLFCLMRKMAERGGFEPPVSLAEYGDLANRCLQPLGHLSKIKRVR